MSRDPLSPEQRKAYNDALARQWSRSIEAERQLAQSENRSVRTPQQLTQAVIQQQEVDRAQRIASGTASDGDLFKASQNKSSTERNLISEQQSVVNSIQNSIQKKGLSQDRVSRLIQAEVALRNSRLPSGFRSSISLEEANRLASNLVKSEISKQNIRDRMDEARSRGEFFDFGTGIKIKSSSVSSGALPTVNVLNVGAVPYSNLKEKKYYEALDRTLKRDDKFKNNFNFYVKKFKGDVREGDKVLVKALKGVVQAGVGLAFIPQVLANIVDKAQIGVRGSITNSDIRRAVREETLGRGGVRSKVLPSIGGSLDPRKPENWAGILFTVYGFRPVLRAGARTSPGFTASVRNLNQVKNEVADYRVRVKAGIKLADRNIKAGVDVGDFTRLKGRLNRLDNNLKNIESRLKTIVKDPKVIKLEDTNPIVQASNVIKNIGKNRNVFHATSVRVGDLFGQKYVGLKSPSAIIKAVEKASLKVPRDIKVGSNLERSILNSLIKENAVIGGARAQNAFVRSILRRKTQDFDVIVSNNRSAIRNVAKDIRKAFPKSKVEVVRVVKLRNDNVKMTVYTLKVDGKKLVDFINKKDVPNLTITKKGKVSYASPKFLAEQKIKALNDPKAIARTAKDLADLKRLTGKLFSDKAFLNKIKDPKNVLSVTRQPKGMGADRIRFGEDQMFFDFSVPTGYAYNSLAKNVFPKWLGRVAGKLGFKKSFVDRLNNLKFVRANDRFVVLQLKSKISNFPKSLSDRIKNAQRGVLNKGQIDKLRRDLVKYINSNPNKVFAGSKTVTRRVGEREVVVPVGSRIVRDKRRFGIDPETKLFFDIVQSSLRGRKVVVPGGFASRVKNLIKLPFDEIRRRFFTPGDLSKVRSWKRQFKKANRLTSPGAEVDIISVFGKMLRSKKAKVSLTQRAKESLSPVSRVGKDVVVRPSTSDLFARSVKVSPKSSGVVSSSSSARFRVQGRVVSRPNVRDVVRVNVRQMSRSQPRSVVRSRTRSVSRGQPRIQPRVVARPNIRQIINPRPRIQPRITPRPRIRLPVRRTPGLPTIPPKFKKKRLTKKEELELSKWVLKQPRKYRPSLGAIIYNVTSTVLPKSVTGLDLRPIIIRARKKK